MQAEGSNKRGYDSLTELEMGESGSTQARRAPVDQLLDSSLFGFAEINASKLSFREGFEAKVYEWTVASQSSDPRILNKCTQVQIQKPRVSKDTGRVIGNVGATQLGSVYPNESVAMPVSHAMFPVVQVLDARKKKIKMGVVWFTNVPLAVRKTASSFPEAAVYKSIEYYATMTSGDRVAQTINVSDNLEERAYADIAELATAWSSISKSRLALKYLTFNCHYAQSGDAGQEVRYGLNEAIGGWSYSAALLSCFGFCPSHLPISGVVNGMGDSLVFESSPDQLQPFFNDLPAKAQGMSTPLPVGYGRPLMIATGALEETVRAVFSNHKAFGTGGTMELVPLDIPRYLATGALNAGAQRVGAVVRNPIPFLTANNLNTIYAFQHLLATTLRSDVDVATVRKQKDEVFKQLETTRASALVRAREAFNINFSDADVALSAIQASNAPPKVIARMNKTLLLFHGSFRYPQADESSLKERDALMLLANPVTTASFFKDEPSQIMSVTISNSNDRATLARCITAPRDASIENTAQTNPTVIGETKDAKKASKRESRLGGVTFDE